MTMDLQDAAKKNGIKFFLVSFTDLRGVLRSKLVPAHAIHAVQTSGAGFAGFAVHLGLSPDNGDLLAVPDTSSLIPLPWQPEVAWVDSVLFWNDKPLEQAPRRVLERTLLAANEAGYGFRTGVECEFYLLDAETSQPIGSDHAQDKPCYDQQSLMRRYEVISQIMEMMHHLGWLPYQADHEDAHGQFELNWGFADAMRTANCHSFFKFMVRTMAGKHGLRASFMPRPFAKLPGNGCHMHLSLWDAKTGKQNLFADSKGELGLSQTAHHFLGGMLKEAPALCAITNPTVNSYKRLHAPALPHSNSPARVISYGGNNHTHMVRIPDRDRMELRLPDGAANPYLLPAAVLAAGLAGLEAKANPGKPSDKNMHISPPANAKALPQTLYEALGQLNKSKALRAKMSNGFLDGFIALKQDEWQTYQGDVCGWERRQYFDV